MYFWQLNVPYFFRRGTQADLSFCCEHMPEGTWYHFGTRSADVDSQYPGLWFNDHAKQTYFNAASKLITFILFFFYPEIVFDISYKLSPQEKCERLFRKKEKKKKKKKISKCLQLKTVTKHFKRLPSGHTTLRQRRVNVDSTSWRWINVESTLFLRCVPAGKFDYIGNLWTIYFGLCQWET